MAGGWAGYFSRSLATSVRSERLRVMRLPSASARAADVHREQVFAKGGEGPPAGHDSESRSPMLRHDLARTPSPGGDSSGSRTGIESRKQAEGVEPPGNIIEGATRQVDTSCATAARLFLDDLQSFSDVRGDVVSLSECNLGVCRGCKACFTLGDERCPLGGDRDMLIGKMMASDGVVFASPNYSFQVSAIMKMFLDRLGFVYHRPEFFGRTFTSIVVQGIHGGGELVKYLDFAGWGLGFNVVKGSCSTAFDCPLQVLCGLRRTGEHHMRITFRTVVSLAAAGACAMGGRAWMDAGAESLAARGVCAPAPADRVHRLVASPSTVAYGYVLVRRDAGPPHRLGRHRRRGHAADQHAGRPRARGGCHLPRSSRRCARSSAR